MNSPLEATPANLSSRARVSRVRWRLAIAFAFAAVLAPAAAATATAASTTWTEVGDAGQTLSTAQVVYGSPTDSLTSITGLISAASDHDLFEIRITNGATFSATTKVPFGTLADTQLFLFNSAGIGVYANDDDASALGTLAARSTLPAGGAPSLITPGLYYLLIDSSLSYPVSTPATVAGLIFPNFTLTSVPIVDSTAVVGPTGPGGGSPLTGYTGTANSFGTYQIALTGAAPAFLPEPNSLVILSTGVLGVLASACLRHRGRIGSALPR